MPDVNWLPVVGARGWIVLTKDRRIQHRQIEIEAIVNAGVRAFVLTAAELTGREQAAAFVRALPRMVRLARASPAALVGRIGASGGVSLLPLSRR